MDRRILHKKGLISTLHNAVSNTMKIFYTEDEKKFLDLVNKSYSSVKVVGRGTVVVDVKEVMNHPATHKLKEKAKKIIREQNK